MVTHQIAAASVAALAVLLTGLSFQVSRLRLRHRVSYGDGGHKDLLIAMRAHGNALEQSSLYALLALAYCVLPAATPGILAVLATGFVVARIVHAAAMFGRRLALRQIAHAASTLVHLGLALAIARVLWTAA
jgi:uncharacterized protein